MTKVVTGLLGVALVMYVTSGISVSYGKGGQWPAVLIGTLCLGGALTLLVMQIRDSRK